MTPTTPIGDASPAVGRPVTLMPHPRDHDAVRLGGEFIALIVQTQDCRLTSGRRNDHEEVVVLPWPDHDVA